MGAELAVHAEQPQQWPTGGWVELHGFADVIVTKLELEMGVWVIVGRVVIKNTDGDNQMVTAKIVHDANVIIDHVTIWAPSATQHCMAVQATLKSRRPETVVLMCNTFSGHVFSGSLIAFKVDNAVP
jgi:hypothetical protein